jgi:hypothetical protein
MSNLGKKLDERSKRPQTLGSALGDLMRIFGVRASDSDLAKRWDEIMGCDIASVARLAAIKKNRDNTFNIVIRPTNPALALQLSYQSDEIIKRINKYFGYNAVSKISFRK